MPLVKLHMATNLEDLQRKAELDLKTLRNTETSRLTKSADKLRKEASLAELRQDEERAYIFYFRFIDLVMALRKRTDFKKDASKNFLNYATEAVDKAEKLKGRLVKRYQLLKESSDKAKQRDEISEPVLIENDNKLTIKNDITSIVEEKSKERGSSYDEEIADAPDRFITVYQLLEMINNKNGSFVIMDVRSSKDFAESHIKHSSCINVPDEIIKPGVTAKEIERQLPNTSKSKYHEKNSVEHVILVGWMSTPTSEDPAINCLEQAMCKWDVVTPLKIPPLILNGGYKEWILRFPMYATKTLDIMALDNPTKELNIMPDALEDVVFPDLDESVNDSLNNLVMDKNKKNAAFIGEDTVSSPLRLTKPQVNRESKPREQMENVFNMITDFGKSLNLVDKPSSKVDISSVKFFEPSPQTQPHSENSKDTGKFSVPEINRSLKPTTTFLTPSLEIDNFNQKDSWKQQNNMSKLERKNSLSHNVENLTEEDLANKKEDIREKRVGHTQPESKVVQSLTDQEIQDKEIRYAELEAEKRKILEAKEGLLRSRQNELNDVEKSHTEKKLIGRDNKLAPIAPTNREKRFTERDTNAITPKKGNGEKGGEYTVLLNESSNSESSGSRGLTRSYSSPNIAAQLIADSLISENTKKKLPPVDRSLKPKIIDNIFSPVKDLRQSRMRNLNSAIHGYIPFRPLTGLRNVGNTCYMNSVIQCLSNTKSLVEYFATDQYRQHLRRNSKEGSRGLVAEEFAMVIRYLWMGTYKSFAPKDFKNIVSKYIPMCVGSEQQDAHEFLIVLMEKLHGDLNQGYDQEGITDSSSENTTLETFWKQHCSRNKSKLSETFEGLIKSTLSCLVCKNTSQNYEVYSCLSLEIFTNRCKLKDCVKSFLKPERMSGEGSWHCPTCKQKQEAEKTLTFCKFPTVLVIQLKRFSYEGMWRRKLQTTVEYESSLEIVPGITYELYALVNHFGLLEGGHYIACCKNAESGKWFKYDDHDVSETNFSDIPQAAAYLLFYYAKRS